MTEVLRRLSFRKYLRGGSALLVAAWLLGGLVSQAEAVPSYARQTGADCAACHVGAYGPQLTPYGIRFKIGGYTDSDGKSGKTPLSAMMVANWTRTAKDLPEAPDHFKTNDNSTVQEASVFLAGRLSENVGSFVQATYSGVDRKSSLDVMDIRYARPLDLGGKEGIFGVSVNNTPTVTDPFNTLGQWRFPYTSSDFGFGSGVTSPKVENLGGSVLGANAYYFWNDSIYAELGAYSALAASTTHRLGTEDQGKFKGMGSYWRIAYFKDRKRDNFSVGVFGFNADTQPDRNDGTTDRFRDLGVDASYQFLGNRQHIFALNASYVREWQKLNYTLGGGGATNLDNTLDNYNLAASYHYKQTWGVTGGLFASNGSSDAVLYGNSYNNRPNTSGYVLQADWTPLGKESSWGAPWANVRIGLQYTGYRRFLGGSTFIDDAGNERRASDNNTTMLFLWTSI